ncbi:MAG: ATP-binding protein [Rubricoccaceae bacterium]
MTDTIPFWSRFSVRLSVLFLALLAGLGAALVLLTDRAAERAAIVADQALHRDLASALAPRFQPYLETDIDEEMLQQMIDGLTQVNRRMDVYLLGGDGMIKSWFSDSRRRPLVPAVETAALDRMMAGADLPVLGVDPARPEARRPFSVAPIRIMGEEGCYLYLILQGERYDAVAADVRRQALAGSLWRGLGLALGVTALLGLILFRVLSRRLERLTETVSAFERGAHSVRAQDSGTDEVARLGGAFDRMATRIQTQIESLARTDALRRELVANVSHDLRSPLAALRGHLETLEMMGPRLDAADRERHVERALRSSERLSSLVTDLFDLARFDAAEVRAHPEPTALDELAHDVVAECQAVAASRDVALSIRASSIPLVTLDGGLVERALVNLLDNALRHTPAGGTVEVEVARADGGTVSVAVRDSGEGIAPEVVSRVFERFVRADESRPSSGGGAGLGLAIVKRIAELHGGSVRVESVLGSGSTFTLTLPIDGPPSSAPAREPQVSQMEG